MKLARRYDELKPYFFAQLAKDKKIARAQGRDVIDLSIGNPDLQPPRAILSKLKEYLDETGIHGYPDYIASDNFRGAAGNWLKRRHDVVVDSETEVTGTIGSKEALAHFLLATVDEGDYVIIPSPHYPMYTNAVKLAGGKPYFLPLSLENGFLPDLDSVPGNVWEKTSVLLLNYPHNPTSAMADESFWKLAIQKASKYGFNICSDAAYLDIYDDNVPLSLLNIPGGKDVGLEFHSLSKTFSIPGWRLGYVAGNPKLISALRKVKQSIDSGQFTPLDLAASYMLDHGDDAVDGTRAIYAERRRTFKPKLEGLGFEIFSKPSTLYLWAKVPGNKKSAEFGREILDKVNVAVTPGITFGDEGEGYVRFSLTVPSQRLEEAVERMIKL